MIIAKWTRYTQNETLANGTKKFIDRLKIFIKFLTYNIEIGSF